MTKTVYVVTELNARGDDFDIFFTFNLDEARTAIEDIADRGYRLNKKSPATTTYHIFGYAVDTDNIEEDYDYNINDAKSLYNAHLLSVCSADYSFSEDYEAKDDH